MPHLLEIQQLYENVERGFSLMQTTTISAVAMGILHDSESTYDELQELVILLDKLAQKNSFFVPLRKEVRKALPAKLSKLDTEDFTVDPTQENIVPARQMEKQHLYVAPDAQAVRDLLSEVDEIFPILADDTKPHKNSL